MKKILNNNTLFGLIIGIIIMSGIGVLAIDYLYNANQVSYKKADNTEVDVKTALDELYEKTSKSSITYFNNGTIYNAIGKLQTIDLSSYNGYHNFVLDENIFLVLANNVAIVSHYDYDRTSVGSSLRYSYNSETGILTYSVVLGENLNMNYYNSVQFKVLILS